MRLAMAQMQMAASVGENLAKTLQFMEQAAKADADLIFFPEIQLSPFFPQYERRDASPWTMTLDGPEITAIRMACREFHLFCSPNVYLEMNSKRYDASLMIDAEGKILGIATNTKGQLLNLWGIVPNRSQQARKPPQMGVALKRVLPFFCSSPFFFLPLSCLMIAKNQRGDQCATIGMEIGNVVSWLSVVRLGRCYFCKKLNHR